MENPKKKGWFGGKTHCFRKDSYGEYGGGFAHLIRYHNIFSPPPPKKKTIPMTPWNPQLQLFFVIFGRQQQSNVNILKTWTKQSFTKVHYKSNIYNNTVDGSEIPNNHQGCTTKPCK